MELNGLKKEIPYKWRVQSFSKFKPQAQCVAYIDARDVEDILDEVVGGHNWQDNYKVVDGKLFAGIGINTGECWVWKWDTGVESNIEKEKGQSSDAFKRAAVKWGVGRFLYKLAIQYIDANEVKTSSNYPYPVDKVYGKRIWDLTKHINSKMGNKPAPTKPTMISKQQGQDIFLKATAQKWPMSAVKDHMMDICNTGTSASIKIEDYKVLMAAMDKPPMICKRQLARMNILLNKVCPGVETAKDGATAGQNRQDQHNMVGDALQITPPKSLNDLTWVQSEKAIDVLFKLELHPAQGMPPEEHTEEEPF